jgi:hypothetical protein
LSGFPGAAQFPYPLLSRAVVHVDLITLPVGLIIRSRNAELAQSVVLITPQAFTLLSNLASLNKAMS